MNRSLHEELLALPEVSAVERLAVEPGDTVIVKCPGRLTREGLLHLKREIEDAIGDRLKGVPIMILDGGMDIQVLKKDSPFRAT